MNFEMDSYSYTDPDLNADQDPDPDPALFFNGFQDINLQRCHSKSSKSHKTVEINVLNFLFAC